MRITSSFVQQSSRVAVLPLAADEREVLRMGFEVLGWRHEVGECVAEEPVTEADTAAMPGVEARPARIHAIPRGPVAVQALEGIRLAIFQHGDLRFIDRSQGDAGHVWNAADSRGEPAAAEVVLQQAIDAVEVASLFAAGDDEVRPHIADQVAFIAQLFEIDRRAEGFQMAAIAQNYFVLCSRLAIGDDGQLCI